MTVVMSLVEKTWQKVYLDRGWIMNWDQLKAVGIVLEGYPIISVWGFEGFKRHELYSRQLQAASKNSVSKYIRTFNRYELTRRNRTRSITYSALLLTHLYISSSQGNWRHRHNPPDMIRPALQEVSPIASLPKSESLHIRIIIPHWRIAIRCTMEIKVNEFFQICANNLVCVDEYNLLQIHRKKHV